MRPVPATLVAALLLGAATASTEAAASPARETADTLPAGAWSVGAFDPLRIGVTDELELATHPIVTLALSPNVVARLALLRSGSLRLTGEYGVSVPTVAMRLLQGTLFPVWKTSGDRVGFFIVPSVGVALSYGERTVVTGRLETTAGLAVGRNDAKPLDAWAPLELLWAPPLTGHRSRVELSVDGAPFAGAPWLRGRAGAGAWLTGPVDPPRSLVFLGAWVAADVALSKRSTLTLGAIGYDYDQHRTTLVRDSAGHLVRERVRSHDVWPMIDFVYRHE